MKKIILIVIILGVGWYGNYFYKQRYDNFVTQQSPTDSMHRETIKCVTKDGRTFYGNVPQGVDCVLEKPIEGALTVTASQNSQKVATATFRCDGRTHCSQMTSCEEATFFLRNCPNVKMDGDDDRVPCEKQWCNR